MNCQVSCDHSTNLFCCIYFNDIKIYNLFQIKLIELSSCDILHKINHTARY